MCSCGWVVKQEESKGPVARGISHANTFIFGSVAMGHNGALKNLD